MEGKTFVRKQGSAKSKRLKKSKAVLGSWSRFRVTVAPTLGKSVKSPHYRTDVQPALPRIFRKTFWMSAKRRIILFLVHQETGQRYPLTEAEIIVGRSSGDILFPEDFKLSPQHCRIFTTPLGLAIHDLRSAHGTWLDGVKLDPQKMYAFKPGSLLKMGDQALRLHEPSFTKRVPGKRSPKKKKKRGSDSGLWLSALVFVGCLIVFGFHLSEMNKSQASRAVAQVQPVVSPYERVDRDVQMVLEDYKMAASVFNKGTLQDVEIARQIRSRLLPALAGAQSKLTVVKPGNEYERRRMELNIKLLMALTNHLKAYANLVESKDRKYSRDVEKFALESERIKEQLNRLEGTRAPSSQPMK